MALNPNGRQFLLQAPPLTQLSGTESARSPSNPEVNPRGGTLVLVVASPTLKYCCEADARTPRNTPDISGEVK